jgi:predicted TIM-barrel fold metal-dependent hydrolase
MIVDSQIHLWENTRMSPHDRQVPTYAVQDALHEMEAAGVDAAVLHPPSTLGEAVNVQAVEAVRQHPDKFCILGHFDLQSKDRLDIVKNWRQRPGMLGFRFTFNQPHQKNWWSDGSLDWFWAASEREGLVVGLLAGGHMTEVGVIAARHPGLKLHIDHCGRGGGAGGSKDAAAFNDLGDMLALAKIPMLPSNFLARQAIRTSPTLIATFTPIFIRYSTSSARGVASGAPISPACRALTGSA